MTGELTQSGRGHTERGQKQDLGSPYTRGSSILKSTEWKVFRNKAVVYKQTEEGILASQNSLSCRGGQAQETERLKC